MAEVDKVVDVALALATDAGAEDPVALLLDAAADDPAVLEAAWRQCARKGGPVEAGAAAGLLQRAWARHMGLRESAGRIRGEPAPVPTATAATVEAPPVTAPEIEVTGVRGRLRVVVLAAAVALALAGVGALLVVALLRLN